jgi:hypothetical protein
MVLPPSHRVELILLSDQDMPLHFWISANEDWARIIECDKILSIKIILSIILFFFFGFLLSPISIILLILLMSMVVLPTYMVGIIGFYRGW